MVAAPVVAWFALDAAGMIIALRIKEWRRLPRKDRRRIQLGCRA